MVRMTSPGMTATSLAIPEGGVDIEMISSPSPNLPLIGVTKDGNSESAAGRFGIEAVSSDYNRWGKYW